MKERVSGYREDRYFKHFNLVDDSDQGGKVLLQCPVCTQHWLVDIFDKVQNLYALKVDDPEESWDFIKADRGRVYQT